MTSAPKSDSTVAAAGAAMKLAQSRTFSPSKMPFSMMASLPSDCCSCYRAGSAGRGLRSCPFDRCWRGMQPFQRRAGIDYPRRLFLAREQRGIAAGRGGIDGHRLLGGEARKVMWAAGLGTGAGKAVAAERLHADHRADHVAVDVDVAGRQPRDDGLHQVVDAGVDPEREAEACRFDRPQHILEPLGLVAHHMQDRAEYFFSQLV